jgi:hypothetical protein
MMEIQASLLWSGVAMWSPLANGLQVELLSYCWAGVLKSRSESFQLYESLVLVTKEAHVETLPAWLLQ